MTNDSKRGDWVNLKAQALREAADHFESLPMNKDRDGIRSGTWEWFELFPIDHLRERADRLEDADQEDRVRTMTESEFTDALNAARSEALRSASEAYGRQADSITYPMSEVARASYTATKHAARWLKTRSDAALKGAGDE